MSHNGQVLTDISHGVHIVADGSAAAVETAKRRHDLTLQSAAVTGVVPPVPAAGAALLAGAPALAATAGPVEFETKFDYLFLDLVSKPDAHLPAKDAGGIAATIAGLKALGDAMVEDSLAAGEGPLQATGNASIPPVYTYWGQFIDHDLTANTDRDSKVSDITKSDLNPLAPDFVVNNLVNLRQPAVNLDSVYGDGPTFDSKKPTQAAKFYDGAKFRIGKVALNEVPAPVPPATPIPGRPIPPDKLQNGTFVSVDPNRDLPRIGSLLDAGIVKETDFSPQLRAKPNFKQLALIADARNDENLIIAQLHTAFLRFHNSAVDWVKANEPANAKTPKKLFERAQQLTRWHHQWLVVHDFLKTITQPGVADKVLLGKPKFYKLRGGKAWMPLEFSVAAYRFGHTMVRAAYDHNRNFGRPEPGTLPVIDNASFDLMFTFTGNGSPPFLGGTEVLPFNWIIEWDRFVDKGSLFPDHFARKIDTRLAPPLRDMANEGTDAGTSPDIAAILKRLARRNLLRGYLLSIPTGQSVATAMGVPPLTTAELSLGNSGPLNQVLKDHGFLERTPLWYYVLKEAEVRANGNSLGELGSRIVCETIIGQILNDPDSYLRVTGGWDPSKGVRLPTGDPVVTIRDFIRFAGIPA